MTLWGNECYKMIYPTKNSKSHVLTYEIQNAISYHQCDLEL